MTALTLDRAERLELKARAHHLHPVVLLGANGLTPAVVKEIDRALTAHGLIKVRVPGDDRAARETVYAQITEQLSAALVAAVGKLAILYRPQPDEKQARAETAPPRSFKAPARPPRSRQPADTGRNKSFPDQRDLRRSTRPQGARGRSGGRS
jgi:RNA-binding protein